MKMFKTMKQVEDKIALPYNRLAEENENNKSTTLHNNLTLLLKSMKWSLLKNYSDL